ncbi:glycerol-3-phosphate responsive antiterminator [Clostridium isatidis]|uniref:Antiterminator n=1 Tax=Clostridium isatidis TaxID=182773 RepID=A0A343J9U9_9CLOT|nr:glycerol-3-phosphate responsive antiterminator [Clostridium isatidis]ASW42307.1 antiterminator [Clostridium isatidis]NLZ35345.1 glycerol-3-phosphate responsive antiterminator [Clostridiales bacterium]
MDISRVLEDNPIITAVKDDNELEAALDSESKVIFVLYGNIINILNISKKISNKNKIGFVHIDLIEGLSNKEIAVKFIKEKTTFQGIVTTKSSLIRIAKEVGLSTVFRIFILDSLSLKNANKHISNDCDAVEILPGVIPKVIKSISAKYKKPIIVGGLVETKEEVLQALRAGASCISTSNQKIWDI